MKETDYDHLMLKGEKIYLRLKKEGYPYAFHVAVEKVNKELGFTDETINLFEHALIKACYMWATAEYDEDISKSESLLEWGGWRKYDNLKQLFIYLKDDAIPIPAAIQEWVDKLTCKETG